MISDPKFGLLLDLAQTLQLFDFNKMAATLFDVFLSTGKSDGISLDEFQSAYGEAYGLYQSGLFKSEDEWANTLFGLLGMRLNPVELKGFLSEHDATRIRYISLPRNFNETLRELKKDFVLCVASNGIGSWAKSDWKRLGVNPAEFFLFEQYSSDCGFLKPDKRFFESALEKLNLPAKACAIVGDSYEDDMEGGKNAGLSTVWINPGHFSGIRADFSVKSFSDILSIREPLIEKLIIQTEPV